MRLAAMSSIARVIFFVVCALLMRARYSRSWAPMRSPPLCQLGSSASALRLDDLLLIDVVDVGGLEGLRAHLAERVTRARHELLRERVHGLVELRLRVVAQDV